MSHNLSSFSDFKNINEPRNFVRDFLFRGSDVCRNVADIRSSLLMDVHLEGWIGIPHGGVGMGAIMELITVLDNYPEK